jgi:serine/threonine protein kinase
MLRTLEHPSIPKLVASGWDENIGDVMVVEPVGIPIEMQASNPAETWNYLKQVNDVLCYAHEQQTYHRDISPNNIVVADDRAILIDWGIAKTGQHQLQQRVGTSAFCALAVLQLAVVNKLSLKKITHTYRPQDDFESLFYTLLHLLSVKKLPWMKSKDLKTLFCTKYTCMHEHWPYLLKELDLPSEIADKLDAMHTKLFINKDTPVDSLF